MNCEEIKKILDDYIDNQLDEKRKSDLEDSLPYCEEQNNYLKRINSLSKQLNELPLSFDPPKEIISELTDKLMKLSEEELKNEIDDEKIKALDKQSRSIETEKKKKRKTKFFSDLNLSNFTITLLAFTVLVVLLTFYFINFFNDTSPWKIQAQNGSFKLNNATMINASAEGDEIIATSLNSSVSVLIPEEGRMLLGPETSIQILKTKKSLNQVKLLAGKITFESISDKPNFELLFNETTVKAQKAGFTASIDSNGYLQTKCLKNYIEIVTPFDRLLLSDNYQCKISGNIIGLPYSVNASEKFKHQLRNMEANINDVVELTSLIYDATSKDAHTLLRLMEKVTKQNRGIIYQKLYNMFPPTPRITKQGILDGNQEMIDEWWFEIDWQI